MAKGKMPYVELSSDSDDDAQRNAGLPVARHNKPAAASTSANKGKPSNQVTMKKDEEMDSDEGSSDDSSDEDELSEEFEDSSDEDDQWLETVTKSDGTVIPYPQWQVTAPGDSPRGVGGVLHTPLGVQNIKRHSQNYRVLTKQKDVIHPHIPMGTAEQPVGANHLKSPLHVLLRQRYLRGFNGDTLQAYNLRRGWDSLITPFKFWIEEISHREWDSIMRRRAAKKLEFERKKQEKKEAKEEEE